MTRLLVLGTSHLRRGSTREPDQALTSIIDRIVDWKPDAIAIEALPAELIDSYLRLGGPFADLSFGGMRQAESCAEAVRGLHDWTLWQAREVGGDRARNAVERTIAWCAAYEPYTALLHSQAAQDLPQAVRDALRRVEADSGENWRIAGVAAARLGLQRLHPIDDHSNWAASAYTPDVQIEALNASVSPYVRAHPLVADFEAERAEALAQSDLWPLWRRLNSTEAVAESETLESGYLLAHGSPQGLARSALAGWRERNLSMSAKIRAATGDYPGGRVLALVGQSHKGPIEAALGANQWDLEIADIAELDLPTSSP